MKLLDFAIQTTNKYIDEMPKSQRKNMVSFLRVKKLLYLWLNYLMCLRTKHDCKFLTLVPVQVFYRLH